MTREELDNRFKSYSTLALLEILQHSEDYQSIAIDAAKNELNSRHLTNAELSQMLLELETGKKQVLVKKLDSPIYRIRASVKNFLHTINPFDYHQNESERIIRATILWNSIIYLLIIFNRYESASILLDGLLLYPFQTVLAMMPFIFYPLAIIGFALKRKLGWYMLSFFLATTAFSCLWTFLQVQLRLDATDSLSYFYIDRSITALIIPLVIAGTTLFAINKQEVRLVYGVGKRGMLSIIILGLITAALIIFFI